MNSCDTTTWPDAIAYVALCASFCVIVWLLVRARR